ncbi:MAG: formylglycine-generating enzyme family protein, partial [Pirellulales bacterium]
MRKTIVVAVHGLCAGPPPRDIAAMDSTRQTDTLPAMLWGGDGGGVQPRNSRLFSRFAVGSRERLLIALLLAILLGTSVGTLAAGEATPPGMVLVPAGDFRMGADDAHPDEAPARRVTVSAFYIDQHEVTNAQFAAFVREQTQFDSVEGPWFRYSAEGC